MKSVIKVFDTIGKEFFVVFVVVDDVLLFPWLTKRETLYVSM